MKPVALLVGACLLFLGFIAMGPIGWLVVGTLLAVGVIQVHRKRARETDQTHTETGYCPDCGATIELERDTENAADSSAPGQTGTTNCAACGAPNDPDRTTCNHCDAALP